MEHEPYDDESTVFLARSRPIDEATRATLLDQAVWGMPPSEEDPRSPAPSPASASASASGADAPRPGDTARLTAAWHGTASGLSGGPYAPGARRGRGVLAVRLAVAGAALAAALLLVRQQTGDPLSVTGVGVRPSSSTAGCDSTVTVLATIRSNGEGGTLSYRWHRSDGTVSDPIAQRVAPRAGPTEVTLRWTFHGPGSVRATAVLEVLSPNRARAETTFTYTCR
ncbi:MULTISPECIES: hypothetical protein [unclassified Streptomyces]|uniref:hypothetical protein n=1 Tax=unclassified Streptomyces TaxID=2593676 RepID=UPI000691E7F2|nr:MULTISPECIES: hypothetical protein [unclassified Streptomyces]